MTDIVTKLRQYAENDMRVEEVCLTAVDEIERLRKALADILNVKPDWGNESYEMEKIARAALEGK